MPDKIETLREAGAVLYGPAWQSELARQLGVADRTVRYWLAGARPIPPGIWPEVASLLDRHKANLDYATRSVQEARDATA